MSSIFRNELYFLSNMYPCTITYEGLTYPSLECAYQASKSTNTNIRQWFTTIDGYQAKKLGRTIDLRLDWESAKLSVMYELLNIKFSSELSTRLLAITGDIVEYNTHHDNYWGVCTCTRCSDKSKFNKLGRMLTLIRDTKLGR